MGIDDARHAAAVDAPAAGVEKKRPSAGRSSPRRPDTPASPPGRGCQPARCAPCPPCRSPAPCPPPDQARRYRGRSTRKPADRWNRAVSRIARSRRACFSSSVRRLHQGGDLVDIQMKRQALFLFGRGDQFGRVFRDHAAPEQEAEKARIAASLRPMELFLARLRQPGQIAPSSRWSTSPAEQPPPFRGRRTTAAAPDRGDRPPGCGVKHHARFQDRLQTAVSADPDNVIHVVLVRRAAIRSSASSFCCLVSR